MGKHGLPASPARALIEAPAARVWDIAIKSSLGIGDMPVSIRDALRYLHDSGFQMLAIDAKNTVAVETLPAHHQDPTGKTGRRSESQDQLTCS